MSELGQLKRLDPRTVWASEPYDFTPWLRQHIDLLGEALGLEIDAEVQQEVAVGLFSADLLGTDVSTRAGILIENQLEATDHSHLGQLLTYAGGLEADILIWVSTAVREEHRQAVQWLNERTHEDILIFAVEIELFSIDGSKPAPHFKVVAAPNEWQKAGAGRVRSSPRTPTDREERYRAFWRSFIEALRAAADGLTTASPERAPRTNWWGISAGRSGFQDNCSFGWEEGEYIVRAEFYIDVGDKDQNKGIFDALLANREDIEREFGEQLIWSRRDDIRASRVYARRSGGIEDDPASLEDYRDWAVQRMIAIRRVFGPRLQALALPLPVEGTAPPTDAAG